MLVKDALGFILDLGPSSYSHLFLVEKATGGWHPMIDLSHLNEFVLQTPFKIVLLSIQEGDFLASVNLRDTYFQIPIHQSSRKLLRFLSGGVVYQFKALCFRLSTAPQVFTWVFAVVSAWAHSRGIRLLRYLDNGLVLASSEAVAKKHVQDLLSLCHSLGVVINEKSPRLLGGHGQKARPGSALTLSLPVGSDKREVRCRPLADCKLPRYDCQYRGCPGTGVEISISGGEVSFYRIPCSAMTGAFGAPGITGEVGPSRSSSNSLPAVAFEETLVPRVRSSLAPGTSVPGGEGGSVLVDGAGPSPPRGSIRRTSSGPSPVLGRVSVRTGLSPPRSFCVWVWSEEEWLLQINLLEMKAMFLACSHFGR